MIAERAGKGDVVTGDILLAAKCIENGALVLKHNGEALNTGNIGNILATRDLMSDIRAANLFTKAVEKLYKIGSFAFSGLREHVAQGQGQRLTFGENMTAGSANTSNVTGALCAMSAMFFFSLNDVLIKLLSGAYPLKKWSLPAPDRYGNLSRADHAA